MRSAKQVVQAFSSGLRAFSSKGEKYAARAGEHIPAFDNSSRGPKGVMEVPSRLLMGPGPANAHPRVLAAMSLPLLGHMHPPFLKIMDEIQEGLRYTFQTKSKYTLMASGTGHAGMEMCIANLVEPGDKVVVGTAGIWGDRVAEMTRRFRGDVVEVRAPLGEALTYDALKAAITAHKPKLLFLCQGESSTGTHQSLAGLGELCRKNGTLLLVDTVCSLGGVPLFADDWGIDAIYSGSQKCLSGPPGAAPVMLGERALEKLLARKSPPATYNLDLNLVGDYWGWFGKRSYHHTGPVSTFYAMREAMAIVAEEGLDAMWKRHLDMHHQLWAGLKSLGLKPFVEKDEFRLATVNTIKVPQGVDWAALTKFAMDKYQVEIAGGLGPTVGKVFRVGIMGYNAKPQNIELVVAAFREGLKAQGKL
mmetsp:Transcript_19465/g.49517  ORF Transcript_19465/g.49517 Transcript_19465/m.49517 type:complete len:419 (-) Transcript_19465:650-1906(-)|eukprot:CAMPEP_0202865452 /NCGR_PEP_ID=MMETSP1391-20130828/6035_1 /ASSEMBLY_ACC=CAM_ASM_000867 /TAXON_ID=1034604 /ORGANISM="Chlamydomonas leiostraca, Strain SAG 11-49" /LENGTH=418 /DNA_ID=CAMNT_0049545299 /DNA_START=59 /DNA_END=1315 /DNA_ORIENTATION=+